MTAKLKDPNSTLDYVFNFGRWLVPGDTIVTKTVTAPAGLTVNSSTITAGLDANGGTVTAGAVLAWLTGGTLGVRYDVVCHITTAAGRVEDLTGIIIVADK